MRRLAPLFALLASSLLAACAHRAPAPLADPLAATPGEHRLWLLTPQQQLLQVMAHAPQQVRARVAVQGLAAGDRLVGIDYRVSRGRLYALSAQGRLYTLATDTGRLSAVGSAAALALPAGRVGFDFNPAADRVRVVADNGLNLRLHPDTGALAATDPALHYAPGDSGAGLLPQVAAAAYTYHPQNDKLTTNYAIDLGRGMLVLQGSRDGVQPAVSPNTGRLFSVGPLGLPLLDDAAFDISDVHNHAYAALRVGGFTRLYRLDLASGRAQAVGPLADGGPVLGLAIEP